MQVGKPVFGGAAVALGIVGLAWGAFAFAWQPIPPDMPGYSLLAYTAGGALLLGGSGIVLNRYVIISSIILAVVYMVFTVPWAVRVVRFPQMFGTWGGLAENLSLVLAAAMLLLARLDPAASGTVKAKHACIKTYSVCAIVFGFNHFFSLQQTASMVPTWLPPGTMFWAVATGIFHCAAGVAILTNTKAVLATRLLVCMMLVFEALVWLPYLIKSPSTHMVWAGNATDIALAGAAIVIADALAKQSGQAPKVSRKQ